MYYSYKIDTIFEWLDSFLVYIQVISSAFNVRRSCVIDKYRQEKLLAFGRCLKTLKLYVGTTDGTHVVSVNRMDASQRHAELDHAGPSNIEC
jgi:hypothetical protein